MILDYCDIVCGNILWCFVLLSVICGLYYYLLSVLIIMAPKKRSKNDAGSSSSRPAFDANLFANVRAFERYQALSTKVLIQD